MLVYVFIPLLLGLTFAVYYLSVRLSESTVSEVIAEALSEKEIVISNDLVSAEILLPGTKAESESIASLVNKAEQLVVDFGVLSAKAVSLQLDPSGEVIQIKTAQHYIDEAKDKNTVVNFRDGKAVAQTGFNFARLANLHLKEKIEQHQSVIDLHNNLVGACVATKQLVKASVTYISGVRRLALHESVERRINSGWVTLGQLDHAAEIRLKQVEELLAKVPEKIKFNDTYAVREVHARAKVWLEQVRGYADTAEALGLFLTADTAVDRAHAAQELLAQVSYMFSAYVDKETRKLIAESYEVYKGVVDTDPAQCNKYIALVKVIIDVIELDIGKETDKCTERRAARMGDKRTLAYLSSPQYRIDSLNDRFPPALTPNERSARESSWHYDGPCNCH